MSTDICKCTGKGCPLKMECHRYTSKQHSISQAFFAEVPYKAGQCEHFWDNAGRMKFTQKQLDCDENEDLDTVTLDPL